MLPLTGEPCLSSPVSGSLSHAPFTLALAAQWGQSVGASCFTRVSLFFLCPVGPFCQALSRCPARPFSLSLCAVGLPCQLRPPRAHRELASAHSRTSPGSSATSLCPCPQPFLSPTRARTHSPASFHAVPPSLALCSRRQTSPKTRARFLVHLARRRARQATPSSAPR
jgi:hypothetical protein